MMDLKWALNAFCLGMASMCKWSPLSSAISKRRVLGLSVTSLALETISLSITFSYFWANDYSLFDFLDYPVLLLQNVALFTLFFLLERSDLVNVGVAILAVYVATVYGLATNAIPFSVLRILSSCTLVISSSSKVAQMRDLVVNRRGDLVPKAPWAIFALTSAARFTTVYMETADRTLLSLYGVSVVLNSMVIVFTEIFKPSKIVKIEDKKK